MLFGTLHPALHSAAGHRAAAHAVAGGRAAALAAAFSHSFQAALTVNIALIAATLVLALAAPRRGALPGPGSAAVLRPADDRPPSRVA